MTELKFKLKMRFGRHEYLLCPVWAGPDQVTWSWTKDHPQFDSIHPFVFQDRNGQDVYQDDRIRGVTETKLDESVPVEGYVDYMNESYCWYLDIVDKGIYIPLEEVDDIELIPDEVQP